MMNQRELDVLNILWRVGEPLTATGIVEADSKKGLTQSTVIAVLRKLLDNGLVENCGVIHSGKVLSRTYRATEKSREVVLDSVMKLYDSVSAVITAEELIARLQTVNN